MEVRRPEQKKTLYDYQEEDLKKIFQHIDDLPQGTNILYQLPTGGGQNDDLLSRSKDILPRNLGEHNGFTT
ncbi:MAG: hypothetical protein AAFU57_14790, partial [Bacteroidota bacterium]